ncbi:hypothetical protein [Streptomyces sp. NPDC055692]|uniref:hypothetical protein n=1 Tax=Streptomyces sp. NPDC055692 TaxID=3155683 RepID=UPI00344AC2D0
MDYLGKTRPRRLTMLPDGSVLHDRAMSKVRNGERGRGGVERRLVALGAGAVARSRYVWNIW